MTCAARRNRGAAARFPEDPAAAPRHIGIAVYRDSSGTVWLTQDFSN